MKLFMYALAAWLAMVVAAYAQSTFPTPTGPATVGVVQMCLNAGGQAIPQGPSCLPGSSSGTVTIVDGANVVEGSTTGAPCGLPATTAACTIEATLKAIANTIFNNLAVLVANNADAVASSASAGVPEIGYLYGYNGATWDRLQVDGSKNLKVTPASPAVLGSYCMGANTGTMAAGLGGGSPVYAFRYGAANLAIVRKIVVEADDITTAFVAGAAKFDLFAARAFTASDTGGTAATLTGNNGKLRTSYATTGISDLRISSTATLTAGTRTLDAQPLASLEFPVSTSIDAALLPTTTLFGAPGAEQPLILAQNEGFVIQATVPGTGTWVFSARVCWDEVAAF